MGFRMFWKYVIGRTKTVFKNYNVIERAEKVMEAEKRVAPRHPGTEAKFKVLVKGIPEVEPDFEKKPEELLDWLKIVKVTSEGKNEDKSERSLPQRREPVGIPTYGYEEPKFVPEGKCTLKEALKFIVNHNKDPTNYSVESIAKAQNMKQIDVENVINHFKVFQMYVGRDDKKASKLVGDNLVVNKVVQPMFKPEFAHLENKDLPNPDDTSPAKK